MTTSRSFTLERRERGKSLKVNARKEYDNHIQKVFNDKRITPEEFEELKTSEVHFERYSTMYTADPMLARRSIEWIVNTKQIM